MNSTVDEFYRDVCKNKGIDQEDPLIFVSYNLAKKAHQGKKKSSGEAFIMHCIRTMGILSDWGLSKQILAAGLLHDVMDIPNTPGPVLFRDLQKAVGSEIAKTVKELNQLNTIQQTDQVGSTYENFLSLLGTSSKLQALLIKLASGLELARTIELIKNSSKKKERARFLLSIYSPTAAKLGMWQYKSELEELCFKSWFPDEYELLFAWRETAVEEKKYVIHFLQKEIMNRHNHAEIRFVKRNLFSIFENLQKRPTNNIDQGRFKISVPQGKPSVL